MKRHFSVPLRLRMAGCPERYRVLGHDWRCVGASHERGSFGIPAFSFDVAHERTVINWECSRCFDREITYVIGKDVRWKFSPEPDVVMVSDMAKISDSQGYVVERQINDCDTVKNGNVQELWVDPYSLIKT